MPSVFCIHYGKFNTKERERKKYQARGEDLAHLDVYLTSSPCHTQDSPQKLLVTLKLACVADVLDAKQLVHEFVERALIMRQRLEIVWSRDSQGGGSQHLDVAVRSWGGEESFHAVFMWNRRTVDALLVELVFHLTSCTAPVFQSGQGHRTWPAVHSWDPALHTWDMGPLFDRVASARAGASAAGTAARSKEWEPRG